MTRIRAVPSTRIASGKTCSGRLTWQVTPRNKVGVFWDEQVVCRTCEGTTIGITDPRLAPEAGGLSQYKPLRVQQATWSSPVTTRLLLDAGLGTTYYGWGNFERIPNPTRNLTRVTESCASGCANNGGVAGITYRSQDFRRQLHRRLHVARVGIVHHRRAQHEGRAIWAPSSRMTARGPPTIRTSRISSTTACPTGSRELISPWVNNSRAAWDAIYAQEQWTHEPAHAAGRAQVRHRPQLVSGAADRPVTVPAEANRLPGDQRRGQLQGHLAAHRRGVRRLRQRPHGDQGQHRQVSRRCRHGRQLRQRQSHAAHAVNGRPFQYAGHHPLLDRLQQQLLA